MALRMILPDPLVRKIPFCNQFLRMTSRHGKSVLVYPTSIRWVVGSYLLDGYDVMDCVFLADLLRYPSKGSQTRPKS